MRTFVCAALVLLAAARVVAAAPPELTDADVAPCKRAATWKDKGPTKLEPSEQPSGGRTFQTFECGNEWPVDIDWLDYGSTAEAEWQAAWFRHRLWYDVDPDATSIVRLMIKGSQLSIIVSAHPERMIAVLAKRGWTATTGVFPRRPVAEPTDADLRHWKALLACGESPEPGYERLHDQYARYCAALDAFATGAAPGSVKPALMTALRTRDPAELLAWLRRDKDDASFGTYIPATQDDTYRAQTLLYALQTGTVPARHAEGATCEGARQDARVRARRPRRVRAHDRERLRRRRAGDQRRMGSRRGRRQMTRC
jgi:hypothetical protein